MKMPFLNKVMKETQRKYAAATHTDRVCTDPEGYSLQPFSDFVIPCGMSVFIPIYAIGRDSKYFENPLKYDPERVDANSFEELTSLSDFTFGAGPRMCLGEKIANVELRRFFVEIFKNYRVEICEETVDEFVLSKKGFLFRSDDSIVLNFVRDS
jgi:cytochrome P450